MSIMSDIEDSVFFSKSQLGEIFAATWNEYCDESGVCISDVVDSFRANALRLVRDFAIEIAGKT